MQTCRPRAARHCTGPGGGRTSHQRLRRHPTDPATPPPRSSLRQRGHSHTGPGGQRPHCRTAKKITGGYIWDFSAERAPPRGQPRTNLGRRSTRRTQRHYGTAVASTPALPRRGCDGLESRGSWWLTWLRSPGMRWRRGSYSQSELHAGTRITSLPHRTAWAGLPGRKARGLRRGRARQASVLLAPLLDNCAHHGGVHGWLGGRGPLRGDVLPSVIWPASSPKYGCLAPQGC